MRARHVMAFMFVMLLLSSSVFAGEPDVAWKIAPDTYGTSDNIYMWIPAVNFNPLSSGGYGYDAGGYRFRTGSGSHLYAAGLNLPTGALLTGVRLFYYDVEAIYDVTMEVFRFYGVWDTEQLAAVSSEGAPGFGSVAAFGINHTISNLNNQYVVMVGLSADVTDPSLEFKGVRVAYQLQISPAPSTATFADVPTSHPFFQYIEALAASGITTGYDDNTFRPSQPITRGQMAVFLSRALGLHWPN